MNRHLVRVALFIVFTLVLFCGGDSANIFDREALRAKRAWVVQTLALDHVPVVADIEMR